MTTYTLGHSPDPDDAFMFYGLATGKTPTGGRRFEHILEDIQTLNERALRGELHITAISIHNYPFVSDTYALTSCGASMGDGYGPMILAREERPVSWLHGKTIAVPGKRTTAYLALCLLLGKDGFQSKVMMFDQIPHAIAAGEVDAGLVIHEGQLTFAKMGLHLVVDLGNWWKELTELPLPLGGNCIRRDMGLPEMREVTAILRASIEYGLAHREQAVQHALQYGRDLDLSLTDRFVGMYVNSWTLDYGETGRRAVVELLRRAALIGMTPPVDRIDFVG